MKPELVEVITKKNVSWRQKAKVRWAKDGDCNSAFFHIWANGRKSKNLIEYLENERGTKVKGEKEIEKEILTFFASYTVPKGNPNLS